jgi:hypothetical protein
MLIDLGSAEFSPTDASASAPLVVSSGATIIGLSPLALGSSSGSTVTGTIVIEHDSAGGALVVAVQQLRAVSSAVADADGAFTLFNVPAGSSQIEAYRGGLSVEPITIDSSAGEQRGGIELIANSRALTQVSGRVAIVNTSAPLATSVSLVLDSTFEQTGAFVRGLMPGQLTATNISGAFDIQAVPEGRYAVVAAFDNDQAVRDPEQSMTDMDVEHIEVTADGQTLQVARALQVTQALAVESPGQSGFEHVVGQQGVTLAWAADPDADGYELRIFDTFGAVVHEKLDLPRDRSSDVMTYALDDGLLRAGLPYQFRVVSWRAPGADRDSRTYLRATEDLRGVFQVDPI